MKKSAYSLFIFLLVIILTPVFVFAQDVEDVCSDDFCGDQTCVYEIDQQDPDYLQLSCYYYLSLIDAKGVSIGFNFGEGYQGEPLDCGVIYYRKGSFLIPEFKRIGNYCSEGRCIVSPTEGLDLDKAFDEVTENDGVIGSMNAECYTEEAEPVDDGKDKPKPIKLKLGVTIPGLEEFSKGDGVEVTNKTLAIYLGGLYKFLIGLAGILAVLMISYGGIIWVFSGGEASKITKAKEIIIGAIMGLVLALGSYLILYTINPKLVRFGALDSLKEVTYKGKTYVLDGTQCKPFTSGPCAPANLGCFGEAAEQASGICRVETGGRSIPSGVDMCLPGLEPVSFGLFQINISAHQLSGLNCPAAFNSGPYTGSDHFCSINSIMVYEACKSKALDNTVNIQKACEIFNASGRKWKAWGANTVCQF